MTSERITFPGHDGSDLAARLDLPDGDHLATAIFAHCFTCSKDIHAARRIAARLNGAGIAVLRFDFTGLGHSGGEFENTSFTSNVEDLKRAAAYLDGRGMPATLMIGHSLGGAAVLKAASELSGLHAVVTLAAPASPAVVTRHFDHALDEIRDKGVAEVDLGGRPFRIGKQFLDDIAEDVLTPAIHNLHAALLIMHAPLDEVVSVDNAAQIFAKAMHPKSFVTLDGADHLISRPEDAEYAAGVIAAWAARYLDLAAPEAPAGAPEGVTRVSEADPDGFLQDVNVGPKHHVLADEPVAYGGTDRGLSPYGFLAAGLGACTSMTIRMYARRKKWPLDHVSVDVTHEKVHAEDRESTGSGKGEKIDTFHRAITLVGDDLTEDQRARLVEIADRCPVHKTLGHASRIETHLAS